MGQEDNYQIWMGEGVGGVQLSAKSYSNVYVHIIIGGWKSGRLKTDEKEWFRPIVIIVKKDIEEKMI